MTLMSHLLIFGPGYSAQRIAMLAEGRGWEVSFVNRERFAEPVSTLAAIRTATHILSSVPPTEAGDPILSVYGEAIALSSARWIGYLSSTGVYGNANGAWIGESATLGGRRRARIEADLAWQALRGDTHIFRLPGIYGPERSALDKLREGTAHRVDVPGHMFSRIHVDDLARGVAASWSQSAGGIFHLSDDEPAPQEQVIAYAAKLERVTLPPLENFEDAKLSPAARGFYSASRRISNNKAKRLLGWRPLYPTYREGLRACLKASQTSRR